MFNHSLRRMGAAILSLALALSLTAVPAAALPTPSSGATASGKNGPPNMGRNQLWTSGS